MRLLVALGLLELVLLTTLGWLPSAHHFPLPGLLIFGLAFAVYAVAAWWVARQPRLDAHDPAKVIRLVWFFAVAMRLALLPLTPELSDDVYRYLWDGHVQLAGLNPYLHAPAAVELEGIRTTFHALINNPSVPTIYPPLAQIAFLVIALLGSSITVAKVMWIGCDLATGWVLARTARETGRSEAPVLLLYLWAPLLVVEVAWSAHLEPLGLLMMALAIRWAHRSGPARASDGKDSPQKAAVLAGAALALSAATKFAPAAALPPLVRRHGWRAGAAFAAAVAVLYLPYAATGSALFTGLRAYGEHWWFMKGAFAVLEGLTGDPDSARRLTGLLVLAVVGGTTVARFDLERALLWIVGAGMILTPTLHPWYVVWMLPMAALRGARAWILLSGLAFIGYLGLTGYQQTGEWAQPALARAALWVPFFIVLGFDTLRAFRKEGPVPGSPHGCQAFSEGR